MLSRIASTLVPVLGRLSVTSELPGPIAPGSIVVANHSSLADPGVVLAALHRLGTEPVVMAAAGLWRVPALGAVLRAGRHIPVQRGTARAAEALDLAAAALAAGRVVLIYGEGGLPKRRDPRDAEPRAFRTGPARLATASGAPVVPLGQCGARRLSSGSTTKQLAGFATAPLRRPALHVHLGAPVRLPGDITEATAAAHHAVTTAWRAAEGHLTDRYS
ncbi:1-acyl-sn-glycerol-3-phosphate acyltransferase [Kitasatospora gansuensis]|uniref:1-acyl-sn-glycerol-3-phosphate acyltransferase n=1 Tax=Kitasatospora gansuensis TaxID=258050 RepID=A0A7W7WLC1_9ACTN|nr:lysophospholipid acyltransferase family protein [Kitasatospora gansuensis]MBB4951118.1 1-acyl-sn-glycerol-3-phosphate acyltransferase [Kitasatospora gansuensis]